METTDLEQEFFRQIEAELEFCSSDTTPLVCSNMANSESKARIIKTIADTSLQGRMSIAQAIVEVERLYSKNDID